MLKCSGLKGPTRVELRTFGKKDVAEKVQQQHQMSNVTPTSSCFASTIGDPISLVLTEQRLHHLSLLKVDQKMDTVLSRLAKLENFKESSGKEDVACQTDDALDDISTKKVLKKAFKRLRSAFEGQNQDRPGTYTSDDVMAIIADEFKDLI